MLNGKFAFVSDRDGSEEIYTISPDGTDLARLRENAARDGFPAWVPDGHTIVPVSNRDGERQLFACDPDGTNVKKLTDARGPRYIPC